MPKLSLKEYPDPILRVKSEPVTAFTPQLDELIADMEQTLLALPNAVGLSAIQVGVPLRVFLINNGGYCQPFINPVITKLEGNYSVREGCLSMPDVYDYIPRAETVTFTHDIQVSGLVTKLTKTFHNFYAVVVQHEMDHLDGKLMYDHFSRQYRKRIDKQFGVIDKK